MHIDFCLKVTLSLFLGLLIGIDRQLKHKPLGLKTCMVISVTSCLITVISIESVEELSGAILSTNRDPMRLTAQIVSGVGFLGAGVILRRSNDAISGLTTAAMIWAASGMGIAVGAGFYSEAFVTVFALIVAVNILPFAIKFLGPAKLSRKDISVRFIVSQSCELTEVMKVIEGSRSKGEPKKDQVEIRHIKLKDLDTGERQIDMILSAFEKKYMTEIYELIKRTNHVLKVEVEAL